jgi:hypothetical protein
MFSPIVNHGVGTTLVCYRSRGRSEVQGIQVVVDRGNGHIMAFAQRENLEGRAQGVVEAKLAYELAGGRECDQLARLVLNHVDRDAGGGSLQTLTTGLIFRSVSH